jgi:hypothetical protein
MASNGTTKRQKTDTTMLHYFRAPGYAEPHVKKLNFKIKAALPEVEAVDTESRLLFLPSRSSRRCLLLSPCLRQVIFFLLRLLLS